MEKINCKECGKEINKKAEICPNCGCRVKSNTLKIAIICLIIVCLLVGGYIGAKYIKHQIDETKRINEERVEKEEKDKLNKEETKMFESYFGNYKLSYNPNLVNSDFSNMNLVDEIKITKKCQSPPEGEDLSNIEIDEDCIVAVDFDTISYSFGSFPKWYYVYKTSDNNSILSFQFQQIAKSEDYNEIVFNKICFKQDVNDSLIQTECPKAKGIKSSYDAKDSIDTKYEFKLTKIK